MKRHLKKSLLIPLIASLALSGCSDTTKSVQMTSNTSDTVYLTIAGKTETVTLTNVGDAKYKQMTPKAINEDFEALMNLIEYNYPYLEINKRVHGVDFLANKTAYKERLKTVKSTEDLHIVLSGIVKDLNNKHTHIVNHENHGTSPTSLFSCYKEAELYGYAAWVETLENPKVAIHYGNLDTRDTGTNSSNSNSNTDTSKNLPKNIKMETLADGQLAYLKINSFEHEYIEKDNAAISAFLQKTKACKSLIIDIRGNSGGSTSYWEELLVQPLVNKPMTYKTYNLYKLGDNNKRLLASLYPDDNANAVASGVPSKNLKPIKSLKALNLKKAKPEVFSDFDVYTEGQASFEPSTTGGFDGKIYLLVDKSVYSSSEAFANFSKNTGFATLVGSRTGGDGICRDPGLFMLPNSGLILRYSCTYGIDQTGAANEEVQTEPDIVVKNTSVVENLMLDSCVLEVLKAEGISR